MTTNNERVSGRPVPAAFQEVLAPGEVVLVQAWAGHNRPWWVIALGFLCFIGPGFLLLLAKVRYSVALTQHRLLLGRSRGLARVTDVRAIDRAAVPLVSISESMLGEPIVRFNGAGLPAKLTFFSARTAHNVVQAKRLLTGLRGEPIPSEETARAGR